MRSWLPSAIGVFLVLSATGCGAKPIPTKGVLTVGGNPLANATVLFTPEDPEGKNATGLTNAEGVFELTTFKLKDGALRGSYKVTVVYSDPIELPKNLKTPEEFQEASAKISAKPSVIPEMYTRLDQTPLTHRVPQDGDANFSVPRVP